MKVVIVKNYQDKTRGRFVCHILINGEDRINSYLPLFESFDHSWCLGFAGQRIW